MLYCILKHKNSFPPEQLQLQTTIHKRAKIKTSANLIQKHTFCLKRNTNLVICIPARQFNSHIHAMSVSVETNLKILQPHQSAASSYVWRNPLLPYIKIIRSSNRLKKPLTKRSRNLAVQNLGEC